jgi:hypothetical protein
MGDSVRFVTPLLAALALIAVALNFWLDFNPPPGRGIATGPAPSPALSERVQAETLRFPMNAKADSVFLVVVEGKETKQRYGSATAFLIDAKCGIFATNAHVAETFTPDARVVLRQPGSDTELEVTAAKVHPAYRKMREIFDEYGPILEYRRTKKGEFDNAVPNVQFDFGLLYTQTNPGVAECTLPEGVTLPAALKLAPVEKLEALKAGDSVAVVGFPGTGNFSAGLAPLAALPRVDFGTLRATGSALPPAKPGPVQKTLLDTVIFHSAATIGGSSGSPIFNTDGEVIAIHARGIGASANGRLYQEGAADTIGALRDLIENRADVELPAYASAIQNRIRDYIPVPVFARSAAITTIRETAVKLGMRESIGESKLIPFAFGADAPAGCVFPDRNCVGAERVSKDFASGRFAFVDIDIDTSKTNVLSAVDFDQEADVSLIPEKVRAKYSNQRGAGFVCPTLFLELAQGKNPESYIIARESQLETLSNILIPAQHAGVKKTKIAAYRPPYCSGNWTKAHFVVTPFELTPGARQNENVSMIDQIGDVLASAANTLGDTVLPASWREEDFRHQ